MLNFLSFFVCCVGAEFFAANNSKISYLGRFSFADNVSASFSWSGSTIQFSFIGTNVSIQLQTYSAIYDILIDGIKSNDVLNASVNTPTFFPLASNLPKALHNVTLRKRTEGSGLPPPQFYGVLTDGTLSTPPPRATRRFEVIGDSITCGYGNLGTYGCSFSYPTEDYFSTYSYNTAQHFGADINVVAWSGKGMVRNYGSPTPSSVDPMPSFYPYTLDVNQGGELWKFSSYLPDLVMINLGTNDYSTNPAPAQSDFQIAYARLITSIRANYPNNPYIALLCGPLIHDPCCSYVQGVVAARNATDKKIFYIDLQVNLQAPADYGCDGHPSVAGHQKMTTQLISALTSITGWTGPAPGPTSQPSAAPGPTSQPSAAPGPTSQPSAASTTQLSVAVFTVACFIACLF